MIRIKIRSLWQGQIGVHQKYVNQAIKNKEDIKFVFNGDEMLIPSDKVREAVKGISAEKFTDRFKGETYHLVYFDWKPNQPKQGKLI